MPYNKCLSLIKTLLLLALVLLCPSAHSIDVVVDNPINYNSTFMRARGNSLPKELNQVSVNSIVYVSNEQITGLGFISNNDLAILDKTGQVWIFNIDNNTILHLASLNPGIYWGLYPAKSGRFLIKGNYRSIPSYEQRYVYYLLDQNGNILWSNNEFQVSELLFTGRNFVGLSVAPSGNAALYALTEKGNAKLVAELGMELDYYNWLMPSEHGLLWLGQSKGPYLIGDENGEPEINLWTSSWNKGAFRVILGSKDTMYANLHGNELVKLNRTSNNIEIIPYLSINDLSTVPNSHPISFAESNQIVAVLYDDILIKYVNNELLIWQQDLLGPENNLWGHLFVDLNCNNYLIIYEDRIVFGNDKINSIRIPGKIITGIQFSQDFQYAAMCTENGQLIILNISYRS